MSDNLDSATELAVRGYGCHVKGSVSGLLLSKRGRREEDRLELRAKYLSSPKDMSSVSKSVGHEAECVHESWLEEYSRSCLLRQCLVCCRKDYRLHRVGPAGKSVREFMPLCDRHRQQLHDFLFEYGIPRENSHEALRLSMGWEVGKYNRRAESYHSNLIKHFFICEGYACRFLGEKGHATGSKMVVASKGDDWLVFLFDVGNAVIGNTRVLDFVLSDFSRAKKLSGLDNMDRLVRPSRKKMISLLREGRIK